MEKAKLFLLITLFCLLGTVGVMAQSPGVDPPQITAQPSTAGQTQFLGGAFTGIGVTATGNASETLAYQWYSSTQQSRTSGTRTLITGATTNEYTPVATTMGTLYYYCKVTGEGGTVPSSVSGAFLVKPPAGDINGNGIIDGSEIAGDANNDGVITAPEIAGDLNGNGIIDGTEIAGDKNGDGVITGTEIVGDVNGDGVITGTEIAGDKNGNGVITSPEIAGDVNGDGTITGTEIVGDVNGNGIIDGTEITGDLNGNGVIVLPEVKGDKNGDGIVDVTIIAGDKNGDGIINGTEIAGDVNCDGTITAPEIAGDVNGDGVIAGTEIAGDINGNGVITSPELAGDLNGNGIIDGNEIAGDKNGDGVITAPEIVGDVNGDGVITGTEIAGDKNGNGVITAPEIAGDVNGDGVISGTEIAGDKNGNGTVTAPELVGDLNGDGVITPPEILGDANGNGVLDAGESSGSTKQLTLKVYLEGLWNGTGMNKCKKWDDNIGDVVDAFAADIVDTISVELHNATYSSIAYQLHGLELHQDGSVTSAGKSYIEVPAAAAADYYITVRTRNHLETTTANLVSFSGATIAYDFTDASTKAFESDPGFTPIKNINGKWMLYSGNPLPMDPPQVNTDAIETSDLFNVSNSVSDVTGIYGYLSVDMNGDGIVDATDIFDLSLPNANTGIYFYFPE